MMLQRSLWVRSATPVMLSQRKLQMTTCNEKQKIREPIGAYLMDGGKEERTQSWQHLDSSLCRRERGR